MALAASPPQLGRGIILHPDQPVPPSFAASPVLTVDADTLKAPRDAVDALHLHWGRREPVIIRLAIDANELKLAGRQTDDRSPWEVGPEFLFEVQRLHFLVWNNNWDWRDGEPVWWWAKKALALGAQPA